MQQLERFFGFKVTLGRSITTAAYESHKKAIREALDKAKIDKEDVELYICQVRVDAVEAHFDPSPLSQKLSTMQIHLGINKKHREEERMYFINNDVKHTLAEVHQPKADKFDLRYLIKGDYFESQNHFHEVVYIVVETSVKPRDRKIKVKFLATPTGPFASKLRNVRVAKTDMDLELDPRIQLRFDV